MIEYKTLTKIVVVDGRQYIACIKSGTEECPIHKGVPNCGECPVFAAILNQLHCFEEIMTDNK